jgi:hypothetical protein
VHTHTDAVTGKFRVGPLPPGVYRITVQANGQSDLETPPESLAQGQEVDLGDVRLPESGTVLVRVQSKDGAPAGEVDLSVYGEGRRPVDLLTVTENIARSHRLPVGSYRLVIHENERVTQQVPFNVSSDHETQLDCDALGGPAVRDSERWAWRIGRNEGWGRPCPAESPPASSCHMARSPRKSRSRKLPTMHPHWWRITGTS